MSHGINSFHMCVIAVRDREQQRNGGGERMRE